MLKKPPISPDNGLQAETGEIAVRKCMPSPAAKIRPTTYEADALRIEDLVGTLEVEVSDSAPVEVVLEGPADNAPLRCGTPRVFRPARFRPLTGPRPRP
jgi:hypothetical protein